MSIRLSNKASAMGAAVLVCFVLGSLGIVVDCRVNWMLERLLLLLLLLLLQLLLLLGKFVSMNMALIVRRMALMKLLARMHMLVMMELLPRR